MELRRVVTLFTVMVGLGTIASSASLIGITSYLHTLTSRIDTIRESVRAAQEIELQLLLHAQNLHLANLTGEADHAVAATQTKTEMYRWYSEAASHVGSEEEQSILERLGEALGAYLAEQASVASAGVSPVESYFQALPLLEQAYADAESLLALNIEQAAVAARQARTWDEIANWIGSSVAAVLAILVVTVIVGARMIVYRPLLGVREGIRRLAERDYSARVAEQGPREIQEIARSFNDMAAAFARQRDSQLSFIAAIAHDLRNPLSAIKMAVGTLALSKTTRSGTQVERTVAIVSRQIDVLVRMVSDLLEAARVEAGRFTIQRHYFDARELVVHVVDLFRAAAPLHNLVAQVPNGPLPVACDSLRMEQVMNNIVSNAIKYSPSGGKIEVRARFERGNVILEVSDQGIGIPAEEQDRVFEPFRRGGTFPKAIPGVGLGLSVARRVVEAHGGQIIVNSVVGIGSTFTISLPSYAYSRQEHSCNFKVCAAQTRNAVRSESLSSETGDSCARRQK